MLGTALGLGVGSPGWALGDTDWGVRATPGVGDTDAHTVSIAAFPGMATELQFRWGLQASVDDAVLEKVPGAQGAQCTFEVAVPGLTTPKPGRHLRRGMHCRQVSGFPSTQNWPGLQAQTRFRCGVHA